MKLSLNRILIQIFLIFLLFTFTGCTDSGNVGPQEYYALISKAKEFLNFSIYIINGDCKYWCQLFSRIYYCYFSLARIVFISKRGFDDEVNHKDIWQLSKKDVRHEYGIELKHIRTHFDYDYNSFEVDVNSPEFKNYLQFIIRNKKTFQIFIKDVREQIPKFYRHHEDSEFWIQKCNNQLDSIVELQKELENHIQKRI